MDLIEAIDISVDHRLFSVSFALKKGEVLGLIGPNGAGKSTLLNAIVGLNAKTGALFIDGLAESKLTDTQRARLIGLLPQSMQSVWSLTVEDVVSLGRIPWGDNNQDAISQAMLSAEVEVFRQRKVNELSGGERARVWLARVLAGQPQILLADEPIASLDIHYQLSVMNALQTYAQQGHGVMVAIHDLSIAARFCDRLCLLNKGKLVAIGRPDEVCNEDLLSDVYGVAVTADLQRWPPVILPS